jgi:hypothetical protein
MWQIIFTHTNHRVLVSTVHDAKETYEFQVYFKYIFRAKNPPNINLFSYYKVVESKKMMDLKLANRKQEKATLRTIAKPQLRHSEKWLLNSNTVRKDVYCETTVSLFRKTTKLQFRNTLSQLAKPQKFPFQIANAKLRFRNISLSEGNKW